jgi:hypothetical protein
MSNGRDLSGRFAQGNPGGPGRPRRTTERSYLAAVADTVTLEDWTAIVQKAKQDALAGDATARAWLGKLLLGAAPPSLTKLAAEAEAGIDAISDDAERLTDVRQMVQSMRR